MSDKPMIGMAMFYAQILPALREKARELGYALGLHGSLVHDLDLIAVPWVEKAAGAEELAKALGAIFGAKVQYFGSRFAEGKWEAVEYPGRRPHGRVIWTIVFGGSVYIDLSVMPTCPS